ncbi:H-2 class I histocompatibility antigen, K-B alpha chain-like isoform X3 [Hippocampus zosterae]|uniref:H-2 class I histocompatibility antigen, K-B alpha chain-like isoform X3 n=1 Tax=Hippocampus zosterae TaxID=109293 RepID=UPI00223CF48C|nr:H-2 class I histocompatibility antigen, K-B alpha chain-like isoform X3 [Hippocampus zosterae]
MRTGLSVRLLFRVRPCDRQPQLVTPCPSATQLWIPRMYLLVLFVAALQTLNVTPALHTLRYFVTASSQIANLPEYWEVAYVDGVQILQFDSKSRKTKAKLDWVNKIAAEDPDLWQRELYGSIYNEQLFKVNLEIAKERFNQTGGVHMIQKMTGCEWDDETGEVAGWDQHRYDGEDFISLEWKTMRWIAAKPQAFITKNKWERSDGQKEYIRRYVTEICPADLKTYVRNGRDFLMRTELPTVFLLQKTPSSPVTCLATGFYPPVWDLFWRKDGEQLYEDVEMGQTLPNHDGTFQTAVHLKVEPAPDAEAKYECVFRLAGVEEAIVVELDDKNILSNARDAEEERVKRVVAIAVTSGVLAVLAAGVAAVLARRRRNRQGEGRQDLPVTLQRPFPPFPSPLPSETRRPSHGEFAPAPALECGNALGHLDVDSRSRFASALLPSDAKNTSGPAQHVLTTPPLKTQNFSFSSGP